MRIAQVAPLYESVPPRYYGGTERVVSYLTEALVAQGHEVTLFASGDSMTGARLVPGCDRALRLDPECVDPLAHHVLMLSRLVQQVAAFDIVHFHIDYLQFPLVRLLHVPHVTTLHGRLDIPDLAALYREFDDMPLLSVSEDQRRPLPFANWTGTVHHGLPRDAYPFSPRPGDYLAFLGRISPEKRVDRAVEIARRAGMRLRIAAKIDRADREYFETHVKGLLSLPQIEYVGELGEADKAAFLGGARALLFPIDWPEPFGLVMIEAMACGTPVIAFRRGSVPEVMQEGVTGFIVDDVEEAIAAVHRLDDIERAGCRRVFEQRFTAERMAADYLRVYGAIRAQRRLPVAG